MLGEKIILSEEGLTVAYENNVEIYIGWDEVYAVSFYKLDEIATVIAYLVFDFENGEFIETHSYMEGFDKLVDNLSKHIRIEFLDWERAFRAAQPGDEAVTIYVQS